MHSYSKENSQADSPLTLGDLLAALALISEKAPPRSLSSQLQNVNCSFGESAQRSVLITNSFHIKEALEYIELVYSVSPPGARDAKMSRMKLSFSFAGKANGSIDVWLNRSENPKPEAPQASRTFGLGISKVRQGRDACDVYPTIALPKAKEVLTCGDGWVELELSSDYLMGGVLQVVLLASEDPKDEAIAEVTHSDENVKWCSRSYEREMLGGQTLEEYHEH